MKKYFDTIQIKLKEAIDIEEIEIVDNSHKHVGHKSFSSEKYHLQLKIKSSYLDSISRFNAQKIIMKTLKEDLKKKIHALEINITK